MTLPSNVINLNAERAKRQPPADPMIQYLEWCAFWWSLVYPTWGEEQ